MFASLLVSVALALGIALPHAHIAAPGLALHPHVSAMDTSGGGPPAICGC